MDNKVDNNESFDAYRRNMHPQQEQGRSVVPSPKRSIAIAFGIFMICVYVGVGVLLLVNFFKWDPSWAWARIVIGIVLCIYGVFRGYRMFRWS